MEKAASHPPVPDGLCEPGDESPGPAPESVGWRSPDHADHRAGGVRIALSNAHPTPQAKIPDNRQERTTRR